MIKQKRTEFIYMRTFLCLLIVLTHILTEFSITNEPDDNQIKILYWIRMFFIIGTPSFIVLSQLLTTLNYNDKLKAGYLKSRLTYILIPYLLMGAFYSYSESLKINDPFLNQFTENVIRGNWYGYFIIIIIQFFFLNWIFYRINPKILFSKWSLLIAFIVNTAYLYAYQNVESVTHFIDSYYPISSQTFIGGWIFYYFFGSFVGRNYERIKAISRNHVALMIFCAMIAFSLFVIIGKHDYWMVGSTDYRIILYVGFMFILLINFSNQFETFMFDSVDLINRYSLFIYLLHPIILYALFEYTSIFQDYTLIFIPISLLFIVGCCTGVGILLREFNIFRFVMGKQPYSSATKHPYVQ
ncbi:acyltransferase family protein [Mammaliicoccus stepanovicii]|uniref:Probable poly-beta-1,6-N-acetyl-D-glucosamine export protein n=1 Tax=Mammaliicoccus stepanovicii TaxID=643214 RepID=A0A240A401_9STAP|nr:acyltransferase family protein [Mammaliicoccus stepanovicii]GGI39463.1 putative poly-beta-1,6-N-acetyl-D-glucosamine export protein [Mammaliicoccus stepanovicii]SNV78019.1 intercellular adhesion protein C [Mammaliicoccus stepanovicii]